MLTKEENLRLVSALDVARDDMKNGYTTIAPQGVLWLAEKVKELNEENGKLTEELQKANKDLADFREHYEG